ncbi:lens fiber membrane intrinsic protein-like [Plakobranchus ocellatus]|uniref:Lens fiber membrane intrinsic protein-like n=1 Tax=Plakobranchus ocellatus TaxID=259542 RepID=A0AAV3ZKP2_9GAST|nr:lens fiber membrane intrinsic protein-like [Plakobranchus ocellatus]
MGFKLIPLIAVGVLGLGNLLHIIGLATPEWVTTDIVLPFVGKQEQTQGLWEGCVNDDCDSLKNEPDWLKASGAMAILGMLAGLGALVIAGLIFVMGLMDKSANKAFGILAVLAAIGSFVLILICVIVYAVKAEDDYDNFDFGYSFGLSIAGAILILLGGFIAMAGNR